MEEYRKYIGRTLLPPGAIRRGGAIEDLNDEGAAEDEFFGEPANLVVCFGNFDYSDFAEDGDELWTVNIGMIISYDKERIITDIVPTAKILANAENRLGEEEPESFIPEEKIIKALNCLTEPEPKEGAFN